MKEQRGCDTSERNMFEPSGLYEATQYANYLFMEFYSKRFIMGR